MLLVSFSSIPQNVALNNDKYIGDDDSTTLAQLKAKVDYGLEKLCDFIHTKRSLTLGCTTLASVKNLITLQFYLKKS